MQPLNVHCIDHQQRQIHCYTDQTCVPSGKPGLRTMGALGAGWRLPIPELTEGIAVGLGVNTPRCVSLLELPTLPEA